MPYLPSAVISARATVWSLQAGIAFPLPVACLIALLPLPHDPATVAAASARLTQLFMHPSWIALLALLAFPLLEEAFYRGILLSLFRRVLPLSVAVVLPTLFFACTHLGQSPATAIFALLAGLFFSWLVVRSRSLLPAMLCHSAVNLAWLFVCTPIFLARGITSAASLAQPLPLALCAASLALLIAAVAMLRQEFNHRDALRPRDVAALPSTPQLA